MGLNQSYCRLPGQATKHFTGNGEKLTYSPAVGCNWLCLAGVYFPLFLSEGISLTDPIDINPTDTDEE